jgi:hypothetical protein
MREPVLPSFARFHYTPAPNRRRETLSVGPLAADFTGGRKDAADAMKGFGPFLVGAIVGGGAVFASLSYHFVHTRDGLEVIPKQSPTFLETYVDVRSFGPSEWASRKGLSEAIVKANRAKIMGETVIDKAQETIKEKVDGVLPPGLHVGGREELPRR